MTSTFTVLFNPCKLLLTCFLVAHNTITTLVHLYLLHEYCFSAVALYYVCWVYHKFITSVIMLKTAIQIVSKMYKATRISFVNFYPFSPQGGVGYASLLDMHYSALKFY